MSKGKADRKRFCEIIIATNGNPSTKDAENCGVSYSQWFELATRLSSSQLVTNAKAVLCKLHK